MLNFRRIDVEDLHYIYSDEYLKPLLTVNPKGEKFGVLADEAGCIKGGLTGYIDGKGAMIQLIRVREGSDHMQLKEGLLRSTIYILDRAGIDKIFLLDGLDYLGKKVGFIKLDNFNDFIIRELGKLIIDDIDGRPFYFLDVENFFKSSCSC